MCGPIAGSKLTQPDNLLIFSLVIVIIDTATKAWFDLQGTSSGEMRWEPL